MPRLRDFKDRNQYRGLMAHFSADNWRQKRAHSLIVARGTREALTHPNGHWRYSPDDPRVKQAVGYWVIRARKHHAIALGRKPLSGTFVVIGHAGSGVVENPFVEEMRVSGRGAVSDQIKKFPERWNGEITCFDGVEVGDKFLRKDGRDEIPVLVSCTKVTAKQCVIGAKTYRIEDARELGRSSQWSRAGDPMNYTPEAHEAAKRERLLRWRRSKLAELRWSKVPTEMIAEVWEVVGELVEPPKEGA